MSNNEHFTLLIIRYLQCKRLFKADRIGGVIAFVILGVFIAISCQLFQNGTYALYYTGFVFMACLFFQVSRKDKRFVYNNLYKPYRAVYFEYVAFVTPVMAGSVFAKQWLCFPLLLLLLTLVPLQTYTINRKAYFTGIGRVFSAKNFEWLGGFRKSFAIIIPLYLLVLAFSWLKFFPLFILWVITIIVMSFYNEFEPLNLLRAQGESASQLLKQKLVRHALLLLSFYTPVLLINSFFHPDYWFVNVIFGVVQCYLLLFTICYKYYMYEPNEKSLTSGMLPILLAFGSLIPFITPVPLVLTFVYYRKATSNLNVYLGD